MILGHRIASPASIEKWHIVFAPFAKEQSNNIKSA
jgi:hypothetical protein